MKSKLKEGYLNRYCICWALAQKNLANLGWRTQALSDFLDLVWLGLKDSFSISVDCNLVASTALPDLEIASKEIIETIALRFLDKKEVTFMKTLDVISQ